MRKARFKKIEKEADFWLHLDNESEEITRKELSLFVTRLHKSLLTKDGQVVLGVFTV